MPESISHLVSFIYSAEERGFSPAARRLGLSPAAVSKNVARLEQHLGVHLFQRTTRQLRLTAEGERYLHEVAEPWRRIEEATLATRQGAGQPGGTLKIGMTPLVGRTYFVPMLEDCWSTSCRAGSWRGGRSACITRAAGCCRPRRGCSSTSSSHVSRSRGWRGSS